MSYSDNQEKLVISNTGTISNNYQWQVITVSSNTVLTAASYPNTYDLIILANNTAAPISIQLPAASTVTGRKFTIKKIGNGITSSVIAAVNISCTTLIDKSGSYELWTHLQSATFISDGSNYYTI